MATAKTSNIRAFRSAVAKLKRKGLLDPSIDARSVKPSRSLDKKLNALQHILDDDAEAVLLSPAETRKKKQQGYRVVKAKGQKARVIVPIYDGEKVSVKKGELVIHHKSGVEEINIDVDVNNPESLRRWVRNNQKRIERMRKRNEVFAFKLKGFNSWDTYGHIDQLIDRLLTYNIFQGDNEQWFEDGIEALQIVKINQRDDWQHGTRKTERRQSYRSDKYQREKKRLARQPKYIQEQKREAAAQRAKEYRARMKGRDKEQYKTESKIRAKQSRDNKRKTAKRKAAGKKKR